MPRTALLAGPASVATGHPLCLAQKMTREQSPEVKFRRANGTITCVSSLIPVEHPIRPSKSKTADCRPNYRTHDGSAKYGTLVCAATRIHYFMDHIISSVCGSLRQNNGSRSNCQGNQLIFHLPSPRTAAGLPLNDKFTQFLTQGRLIRCLTLPVVLGQYRLISLCDEASLSLAFLGREAKPLSKEEFSIVNWRTLSAIETYACHPMYSGAAYPTRWSGSWKMVCVPMQPQT